MRKRCISLVLMLIMMVMAMFISGCGDTVKKESFDIMKYNGTTWSKEATDWSEGGYILYIHTDYKADRAVFDLRYTRGEPNPNDTSVEIVKKMSEITGNEVDLHFDCDSWGRSGDIKFVFKDDKIEYTINNIKDPDSSKWGFGEDKGTFVKNANANVELTEHNKKAFKPVEVAMPSRSTSSSILASIGMTEEQFKNSCGKLGYTRINNPNLAATYSDLIHNPKNYVNLYGYDDYLEVLEKTTSTDGYPMYVLYYAGNYNYGIKLLVFDMRDDPYAPNIVVGDRVKPYMIFKEVREVSGVEVLVFHLISINK